MIIKVTPAEGAHISLQTLQQCSPLLFLQMENEHRREFLVFQIRGEVTEKAFGVLRQRLQEKVAALEVMSGNEDPAF